MKKAELSYTIQQCFAVSIVLCWEFTTTTTTTTTNNNNNNNNNNCDDDDDDDNVSAQIHFNICKEIGVQLDEKTLV